MAIVEHSDGITVPAGEVRGVHGPGTNRSAANWQYDAKGSPIKKSEMKTITNAVYLECSQDDISFALDHSTPQIEYTPQQIQHIAERTSEDRYSAGITEEDLAMINLIPRATKASATEQDTTLEAQAEAVQAFLKQFDKPHWQALVIMLRSARLVGDEVYDRAYPQWKQFANTAEEHFVSTSADIVPERLNQVKQAYNLYQLSRV